MGGGRVLHWHRSHFNDLSQRSLGILLQWGSSPVPLSTLAKVLHKSPEVVRLAIRPWEQQGVVDVRYDEHKTEPHYALVLRHIAEVQRSVKQAFYEHAALGELYFAYGSNLNPARLEGRGIPPRFVSRAYARGYTLGFPRRLRDGGGVAGMIPSADSIVEGALYLMSDEQFKILDRYEEHPRAYFRTPLIVTVAPTPNDRPIVPRLCVVTYEAVPGTSAPPTAEYLGHMITGARFWQLSQETLGFLESITPLRDGVHSSSRRSAAPSSKEQRKKKRRKRKR